QPYFKKNVTGFRRSGDNIFWTPLSGDSKISLMDINGKIVKTASSTSPLRLTNLSAGIYMLTIDDGRGTKSFQMIHAF
ncbi:MAG TPA: T9SS type A sorting domain-containing protein, partial [Chitinispirillaceae bacterium]|nr:T9SS type A sorting domain-containing protein [Chitinispirillaceae bacterium]